MLLESACTRVRTRQVVADGRRLNPKALLFPLKGRCTSEWIRKCGEEESCEEPVHALVVMWNEGQLPCHKHGA